MESRYRGSLGRDVTSLFPTVTIYDSRLMGAYRANSLTIGANVVGP